jgi:hypothetical protein
VNSGSHKVANILVHNELMVVIYIIKIGCPTKNEPQQLGISFLERDWAGGAGIFKVRLGLVEVERYWGEAEIHRNRET